MKKMFFGLLLAMFFASTAQAHDPTDISVSTLAKTSLSWDERPLPSYPTGRPEVTILRIIIPEGATLPGHKHLVINAGVLPSGELTVTTEDKETLTLKAGDPIVELVNKWHSGKNSGNGPAEILVFYAGSHDTPITIVK